MAAVVEQERSGGVAVAAAPFVVERGNVHPLGAIPDADGVNFSVFSENATAVTLLLFDEHDDPEPIADHPSSIRAINKSFHFWHVYVRGAAARHALRLPGRRPAATSTAAATASTRTRCSSIPYALGVTTQPLGPRRRLSARTTTWRPRCAARSSTSTTTTGKATGRSTGR